MGATVSPPPVNVKEYDLAIVVKRLRQPDIIQLHNAGVMIVWDVVDAWPQPTGNEWDREQCMAWLRGQVATIRPAGIVAATRAMAKDCAEFGIPVLALPHHARPRQTINPIRERVLTIGYEGGDYLGYWRAILETECKARGAVFVCNPGNLCDLDIVVAVRSAKGYAARNWKSNVKLANAQGSGTPCILNREAGYKETAGYAEVWADNETEIGLAFDCLAGQDRRATVAASLLTAAPRLDDIAATYKAWLASKF